MEENNSDDEEINPFTSLLIEQQQQNTKPNPFTTAQNNNQQLLQNHFIHSIQSTVIIRQLPSEGIAFQLWPAATSLVSLLDTHRINPTTSPLSTVFTTLNRPPRILELGSGTGIVGIVAAATLGTNVTLTDLPNVVPNLKFNAEVNADVVASSGGAVTFAPLRWGHSADVDMIRDEFDVVIASDVVYHDHLYDPLIETLRFMLIGKKIVFVMAHMKRWKKESTFFKKARKYFSIDVLHVDAPSNGSRVGVVVYRFVDKKVVN
ncbi:frigida-LIKE protein [Trifolium pratense]|uniref:Frigida-LIKE protein n=1 Tax=Trifolium pratense TaxID=57577 RepID=A0A2K3L952_TRIPR|nr:frigida-LIKE protein [Trifolium pratense]